MIKNLRRFMARNRDKGIPNLMLYICVANAILYLYTLFTGDSSVAAVLDFNTPKILQGQVWRCFTWLLTYGVESYGGGVMSLIYIVFYVLFNHWLGSILEGVWGTLRLNLYYFGGAVMTAFVAVILGWIWMIPVYVSAYYLNISLLLAVATLVPEERILLFGIFPLKMRWLALLDIVLIVLSLFSDVALYKNDPVWLVLLVFGTAPVISILNYVLNFGRDVARLLPIRRSYQQRKRHREFQNAAKPNPEWAKDYRSKTGQRPYRHKCTVCGRTDVDHPNLEFRYCSRCKGYFCYCIDHINQHTHIE